MQKRRPKGQCLQFLPNIKIFCHHKVSMNLLFLPKPSFMFQHSQSQNQLISPLTILLTIYSVCTPCLEQQNNLESTNILTILRIKIHDQDMYFHFSQVFISLRNVIVFRVVISKYLLPNLFLSITPWWLLSVTLFILLGEYWSGLSFPSPGNLPYPETEPIVSCIGRGVLYC